MADGRPCLARINSKGHPGPTAGNLSIRGTGGVEGGQVKTRGKVCITSTCLLPGMQITARDTGHCRGIQDITTTLPASSQQQPRISATTPAASSQHQPRFSATRRQLIDVLSSLTDAAYTWWRRRRCMVSYLPFETHVSDTDQES
jgi:hypothetical protein